MNTNSCYAGHPGNAPVIPSLLASSLLTGVVVDDREVADTRRQVVGGWRQEGSCGGPCTRNELIKKAFGDEG